VPNEPLDIARKGIEAWDEFRVEIVELLEEGDAVSGWHLFPSLDDALRHVRQM
jgi:hypothetical protein